MGYRGFRHWGWIIGLLATALMVLLLLFGNTSLGKFKQIKENWATYTTESAIYSASLEEVALNMGYVGFIHHFKNYVLRRDSKYYQPAKDKLGQLLHSLNELEGLTVTVEEKLAVKRLYDTFVEYGEKLERIKGMIDEGASSKEMDQVVKVDDSAALKALHLLIDSAVKRSTSQRMKTEVSFVEAEEFYRQGVYFLVLIPFIAALLLFFMRQLVRSNRRIGEAKKRIDELMDDAPAAILCVNAVGKITRANHRSEDLFGYTYEEFQKIEIEDLIPERFRAGHLQKRERYFDSPYHRAMQSVKELKGIRKNGEEFSAEIALSFSGEGESRFVTLTISDVTERLRAQQEVEEARAKAEAAFQQLEKTQDAIVQSEKMAALGGLVAGVAHEINTPVGNTLASASHLHAQAKKTEIAYHHEELTGEDLEEFFTMSIEATTLMENNSRRAADLIQSFKLVAVDQTSSEARDFNVREYMHEILRSFGHTFKRTDIGIHLHCPETLQAHCDPGVLTQVVTNFLTNSLMHGFEDKTQGDIDINIQLQGDQVELVYRDNGKGIPDEIRSKIFDPFFTTKRGEGGSGLGLNIVYNLVQNSLGGTISYSKNEPYGVIFTMIFPINSGMKDLDGVSNE